MYWNTFYNAQVSAFSISFTGFKAKLQEKLEDSKKNADTGSLNRGTCAAPLVGAGEGAGVVLGAPERRARACIVPALHPALSPGTVSVRRQRQGSDAAPPHWAG